MIDHRPGIGSDPDATPVRQRVFLPHAVLPDFLSLADNHALLAHALSHQDRFAPARVIGDLVNPDLRQSLTWRDFGPLKAVLEQAILARIPEFFATLRIPAFAVDRLETEMVAHGDGAHFHMHMDVHPGKLGRYSDRRLSTVYYFHREPVGFSGGFLRMHALGAMRGDAGVDVAPAQNRLVAFPSIAPHEVSKVHCPSGAFEDSRFAINCWVYRAPGG
jgi:Rps23 Pro-64 3,4-dihydroxylase Tpa1-like proline 4-hydroxylase